MDQQVPLKPETPAKPVANPQPAPAPRPSLPKGASMSRRTKIALAAGTSVLTLVGAIFGIKQFGNTPPPTPKNDEKQVAQATPGTQERDPFEAGSFDIKTPKAETPPPKPAVVPPLDDPRLRNPDPQPKLIEPDPALIRIAEPMPRPMNPDPALIRIPDIDVPAPMGLRPIGHEEVQVPKIEPPAPLAKDPAPIKLEIPPLDAPKPMTTGDLVIPSIDAPKEDPFKKAPPKEAPKVEIKVPALDAPTPKKDPPKIEVPRLDEPDAKRPLIVIPKKETPTPKKDDELLPKIEVPLLEPMGPGPMPRELNVPKIEGPAPKKEEVPLLVPVDSGPRPAPKEIGVSNVKPLPPTAVGRDGGYDEDLHPLGQNENYRTISKRYYEDEAFAAALDQYNRDNPGNGRYVRIPPIEVLMKRYPNATPKAPAKPTSLNDRGTEGSRPPATLSLTDPLPPNPVADYPVYTVAENGETLREIAEKTLGNGEYWRYIHDLNVSLNSNEKVPGGTKLRLPPQARARQ